MSYTKGKLDATNINTIVNAKTRKVIAVLVQGGRPAKELTANARRFVLCWNSHNELLEACKDLYKIIIADNLIPESVSYMQKAKSAISTAEQEVK